MITIVAGFGRCGSSLVMQMLAAGGMPTPGSEYPSYEIPKGRAVNPEAWAAMGGAVKILDPHINRPPAGLPYRWIWIDRNPVEQAKSMVKFMVACGAAVDPAKESIAVSKLAASFMRDRSRANGVMREYSHRILKLRFEDILADPVGAANQIAVFCFVTQEKGKMLDEAAMVKAVIPRHPDCLPYMMEFEQMEREAK
jgi:hypothetical protein